MAVDTFYVHFLYRLFKFNKTEAAIFHFLQAKLS